MIKFNQMSDKPNLTTLVVPTAVGPHVFFDIEQRMIKEAGGFTSYKGKGGWRDDENRQNVIEDIVIYSVANLSEHILLDIASQMILEGHQQSVYAVLPDGRSGTFDPSPITANDPEAYSRAVLKAKAAPEFKNPVFQNGVSPGSDYPDKEWFVASNNGAYDKPQFGNVLK